MLVMRCAVNTSATRSSIAVRPGMPSASQPGRAISASVRISAAGGGVAGSAGAVQRAISSCTARRAGDCVQSVSAALVNPGDPCGSAARRDMPLTVFRAAQAVRNASSWCAHAGESGVMLKMSRRKFPSVVFSSSRRTR